MRESDDLAVGDSGAAGSRPLWLGALDAAIFVLCALAAALLLGRFIEPAHARMVFLAPVIVVAARDGWLAASLATCFSVVAMAAFVDEDVSLSRADLAAIGPHAIFVAVASIAILAICRRRQAAKPADGFRMAMLSSLSHDFKAPLTAILGSISSLRHYGALYDERARDEMLSNAQTEVERLNRYLGSLLDITRLDTKSLAARLEAIDVADVVGAALKRAESVTGNHRPVTSIPADLPMIPLDFMLAEQVLYNLIQNAANHGPEGSEIRIAAEHVPGAVRIAVEDEGPGVPPEHMQRIFEPFHRIPRETARAGLGLGLAIARGFVEAMGGTLAVGRNDSGRGARFVIEIPFQQPAKSLNNHGQ